MFVTMPKKEVRHSDSLDIISKANLKNEVLVVVLMIVSISILLGLDYTGNIVKDDVREVTIFAEKWEFIPSEIKVKHNENIRLRLVTSEQNSTFGFKLSRYMYNQTLKIDPNRTTYYDFQAVTKGTFGYRCENPCGFGKNLMKGRLVVE